jgi:ATP-binding cassette subfamily C (CFTR/MRP) protein 4
VQSCLATNTATIVTESNIGMCRADDPADDKDDAESVYNVKDENDSGSSSQKNGAPRRALDKMDDRAPNMMENASFLSRLLFRWPYPLLRLGLQRPLEDEDLPEIMKVDSSKYNCDYFNTIWKAEQERNPENPSLHRAFFRDYFGSLWYIQPFLCLAATAKIVQAVVLGLLIESFETGNSADGYKWASLLVVSGVIILFEHHHVFFVTWRKGMQLRISCVASIYSKSLRLSSTHQETNASTGKIMNLASNDVERFLLAALFINYLFWSPVQSIAILVVGWLSLGPAFAAGFALLIFGFVPFQIYLSRKFAFFRSKIAAITDRRVTFVSQAIHGARIMKMSGYEWRFLDRIQSIREEETAQIAKANRLKGWNETLFFSANVIISLVIFLVHVSIGGVLTPRDVFTVLTLINVLQLEMTKHVSLGVMGVSEVYVSIRRIQAFLEFPELPITSSGQQAKEDEQNELQEKVMNDVDDASPSEMTTALSLSNVNCYWNDVRNVSLKNDISPPSFDRSHTTTPDEDSVTVDLISALSDVSIDFKRGELSCIIGTVGCGKSALIQTLVGELPVHDGTLKRDYESLAYASQDPWIMDGTVQENVTMGLELKQDWYDQVVDACGLRVDFGQFLNGDQTIVGDRGVQCSGGQRARIGLARALYRDADVLVVDDPLSAVDAKVGRQLFNEALLSLGVERGKCVVLATHQHQYVSDHRCILMSAGKIQTIGSYEECVAAAGGVLNAHVADSAVENLVETAATETEPLLHDISTIDNSQPVDVAHIVALDDTKEDKVAGVVRMETYKKYAEAMGGIWVAFFLLILFTVTQATALIAVATMGRWAERPPSQQNDKDIILTVVLLGTGVVILACFRAMLCFELTIKASRTLHDKMTKAVIRAKIAFFDTQPLGRILNRFSADVGSNDDMLPQTLFDFTMILFIVLGAVATTITVLPIALVALPPLVWYFISVRRVFVSSTRELKRLEGLARSPIFAMLSESLSGIATIRSNDSVDYFVKKFQSAHNSHTRAFFSFIAASRWVGFRMDLIMFLLMVLVSFLSVLFTQQGWFEIDPAILGLSISMLLQLAGIFQWCIRQSAEVVNLMVSVERVQSYGELEPEAPLELPSDSSLGTEWPDKGAIEVKDMAVRYRPVLARALDGVSFSIPSGSRVGVVGRTGSGSTYSIQRWKDRWFYFILLLLTPILSPFSILLQLTREYGGSNFVSASRSGTRKYFHRWR